MTLPLFIEYAGLLAVRLSSLSDFVPGVIYINFRKNNITLPKKTELHIEALKKYVIYSLKEKSALAKGDLKEVKEWNSLADKAADNAQLKIKQLEQKISQLKLAQKQK